MKFQSTLKTKLIYVMSYNIPSHNNCLKIGEATFDTENFIGIEPNSKILNEAAKNRINQYSQTGGISYDLLYTEVSIFIKNKTICSFNDKEVHLVLERSGIKKKLFDTENKADEWFVTDLETAKNAIKATKEGRQSLNNTEISTENTPIAFRPEQKEAIEKTKKQFKKGNEMLWFAKMRFGKTLTSLQIIKDLQFNRTLILTHRPVVDKGWFEDYSKIFYDAPDYLYGSKNNGEIFENLEIEFSQNNNKYIYFASMQDLRGSAQVGGNFDKNNEIFSTDWDFIIIDEAHEGTQTDLGKNVITELKKENTKILHLSGTPFNLLDNYKEEEIYTWDYVMEQKAKADWDKIHFGDPNPYSSLPRLNIFTYDLGEIIDKYTEIEDSAFNFREFFKVNENGQFLHEKDIMHFLNILCNTDNQSNYPYSTEQYRNNFRHSLWMVPGVKEAKALSTLLQSHPVFSHFSIVNVAGDGDEEQKNEDALKMVENAIGKNPDETFSITLSCGRLTTGVSVPAWSAVFMLSGSYNTSASTYMQTIFRVQTPATINGRVKEECFVFDFAPDRTLKVIAETAKVSAKAGKTSSNDRQTMGEFLNFCPIISVEGSQMKTYEANGMLEQLKKVYIERVVKNGFEDRFLYNEDKLMKLDGVEINDFNGLKEIIGTTQAMPKAKDIDINKQGLSKEEYEKLEDAKKKKKRELTEEEKKLLDKENEYKKLRDTAISILRGISIRMPLLIYGAEVKDEDKQINIDNFSQLIDDQSWEEFMPKGVTKDVFENFKKYYEPDVFRAAGKRIRAMARAADHLSIEERIARITTIFSTFRNPDKETVLTPWRVVNMHMGDCLGGYVFYDENMENTIEQPRYVNHGEVTENVFAEDAKILEINSKSGLYPLYMAYGIYKRKLDAKYPKKDELPTIEEQQKIWDKVIADNIFVLCKTPMAKSITKRTLAGFREAKVNTRYFEDLVNQITHKQHNFLDKVKQGKTYWKSNNSDDMKFNAIVGNPPYHDTGGAGGNNDAPIFQHFCRIASKVTSGYASLVIPSRWFAAGRENLLGDFRKEMLNSGKVQKLVVYSDGSKLFSNVEIKGGVCYYLENISHNDKCNYILHRDGEIQQSEISLNKFDILIREPKLSAIVEKVETVRKSNKLKTVDTIISSDTPFGIPSNPKDSKKTPFRVFSTSSNEHNTLLYHIEKGVRKIEYVKRTEISKNKKDIDKYKVFVTGAGGSGNDPKVMGDPEYAPKNSVCSQSYLYSAFETEIEAKNFIKYIKTRFFRVLVSAIKITQSAPSRVYKFVPLEILDNKSEIDWSKHIPEIDKQLYTKYGLTKEEIGFLESMIKPME